MTRTFEQRTDNVYLWKEICELHWTRVLGEFHNDAEFWDDLFHSMERQDWEDVIEVAKALEIAHGQETRRYTTLPYNIEVVEKRLHKLQPAIKPHNRQNYNKPAVSLFMAVRDVLNEINDTPTQRWTDQQRAKIIEDRGHNHFTKLFDIEQPKHGKQT